jgi:hypothetical protein
VSDVPDHNAPRWLMTRYLAADRAPRGLAGWYVIRICPCHFGEVVTIPLPDEAWAETVRDVILSVSS